MIRPFATFFALISMWPTLACAQADQGQASPTPSQQNSAQTPSDTPASTAPAAKPKKVWTNEDIKGAGSVSVIGDARNQKYTMTKPADPAMIAKYRTSLQKLQKQVADANERIQEYKEFESGKPAPDAGRDMSHGYNRTPVDQQIANLEAKKKLLQEQMDAIYDAARKDGIESGQLK
jgi:hypothetical protein